MNYCQSVRFIRLCWLTKARLWVFLLQKKYFKKPRMSNFIFPQKRYNCISFDFDSFHEMTQMNKQCLFVCLGLTSLLNIWGHIATVPACSSGTLTNVLPHRNAMAQTEDMTPQPVTAYRHGADLSLCYPLMWNVTLEYITTHFNVFGQTRPENPYPKFHTHQQTLNFMKLLLW